jgi:hypothetical protein
MLYTVSIVREISMKTQKFGTLPEFHLFNHRGDFWIKVELDSDHMNAVKHGNPEFRKFFDESTLVEAVGLKS